MNLERLRKKVKSSLKNLRFVASVCRTLVETWQGKKGPAPPHPFDREHGTDTGGAVWRNDLLVGSDNDAHNNGYVGTPPSRLREGLARWEATLETERLSDFSFVDLGCGKGRAVLVASERPFRQATGVELNPRLVQAAQGNIERWVAAGKARCPVQVVQGDVTRTELPDGPCLVFIYNAFGNAVLTQVLDRIEERTAKGGDRVDVLFHTELPDNPLPHDPRLRSLWRGNLGLSLKDGVYDPVASRHDVTSIYRWV